MSDLNSSVERLIVQAGNTKNADDALKFAQAAQNAATALYSLEAVRNAKDRP